MLKICLVFWKSEPQYAYKLYAYKKKHVFYHLLQFLSPNISSEYFAPTGKSLLLKD